jgi:hypothetical protein
MFLQEIAEFINLELKNHKIFVKIINNHLYN